MTQTTGNAGATTRRKVVVPTGKQDDATTPAVNESQTELVQLDTETDDEFAARVAAAQQAAATEAQQSGADVVAQQAAADEANRLAAEEAAKAAAEVARIQAEQAAAKLAAEVLAKEKDLAEYNAAQALKAAKIEQEKLAALDLVDVVVPKTFRLMLDTHDVVTYTDGTYPMPRAHAEHWYSKANGVKLYTPVK